MKVFIMLLVIFMVILLASLISFYLLHKKINSMKTNDKTISWWLKYSRGISLGAIIFSISGIFVNIINYF